MAGRSPDRSDDVSGDITHTAGVYKDLHISNSFRIPTPTQYNNGQLHQILVDCIPLMHLLFVNQGSIVSAIGRGIEAIIMSIAGVIMAIVGAITTVRPLWLHSLDCMTHTTTPQVIVTIFDLITDILCCRCCSGRRHSGTRVGSRRRFGRSRY